MPEYLSPGVYIEEVDSGPRPIEGVGTATAAFVGLTPAGPPRQPQLITNWSQFVETFGAIDENGRRNPHMSGAYLSHAVYGFFLNGGGRCYVTRIVPDGATETSSQPQAQPLALPSRSSQAITSLTATPKEPLSEDIQIEIAPPAGENPPEENFTLKVKRGDIEEVYENVSLSRRSGTTNVIEAVREKSQLITLEEGSASGPLAERAPSIGTYILRAQPMELTTTTTSFSPADFVGDVTERSGVEGLEIAEDVTMVCCPDIMAAYQAGALDLEGVKAIQLAMINHCERMGDRMAILDTPPGLTPQQAREWRQVTTNFDSKFAALYYPWIKVAGDNGAPITIPPSGHMAGIWARNDNERGVHKAPANEVVRGALEVETPITKGEQDVLNPIGVNCIRSFTGRGIRVWGARTLSSDPAWRYINVRRLFNYVEKSIENGTQWVVFEPNDPDLWHRVRRDITAFLTGVWRDGMLFGLSPDQAFFVKCDEELNPPDVRDRGQLIVDIGLAPVKPAEFVIFRLSQWTGGGA